jgi:hypothetical protein
MAAATTALVVAAILEPESRRPRKTGAVNAEQILAMHGKHWEGRHRPLESTPACPGARGSSLAIAGALGGDRPTGPGAGPLCA